MAGRLPQYLMTQMMSAPLTPNYLLLLRGSAVLPPPPVLLKAVISMASGGGMYSIWLTNFRRGGFASAYLRRSGCRPKRNVKCGDLRLIADENTPSKRWPLERIIKTFPGKDGLVRSAQVKTS